MSRFSDALQRGSGSNVILLQCSDVRDIIIPRDLCPREFYVALTDFLRQAGFDNVVYFDPGLALGKYVYDDQSARYSIPGNETAPAAAPAAPALAAPASLLLLVRPRHRLRPAHRKAPKKSLSTSRRI